MKTGKQVWKQKFADYKEGYIGVIAPLVANGVVITGMAGGDSTTRGFLDGWDPDTGPTSLASLHHTGARRARLRHLAQGHSGRLEIRRRSDMAERLV